MLNKKIWMNSGTRQRGFWITVAIFISVAIFVFSSQSTNKTEVLSDTVAGLISIEQKDNEIKVSNEALFLGLLLRKVAQIFLYALLGFSIYYAFDSIRGRFFWAIGIAFAVVVLGELQQAWGGWYGWWADTFIDLAGILLGIWVAVLVVFLLRTLRKAFEKADSKKFVRIERILDGVSLAAVMHYAFYRFLHSTMFSFYYPTLYKVATILFMLAAGGVRFLYIVLKKCWADPDPRAWSYMFLQYALAFCLAVPFVYVGLLYNYKWLIPIPLAVMCLYDMDAQKICRTFVVTMGILVGALVLCCLSGTVRNLVIRRTWGRYIGAYGTINRTDFGSYFIFLLITAWCGLRNQKWYTAIFFSAMITGVTYLVWWYTGSRTVYYSGALLIIFVLWDCLEEKVLRRSKTLCAVGGGVNWLSTAAFPLICIFQFWMVVCFGAQDPLALKIESISERLSVIWNPLSSYGVHAFGNTLSSTRGVGGTIIPSSYLNTEYGYIDSAYGMLVIQYGWVITIIVTVIWVWMTARALRSGNNRIAFAMAILAFHAFSETRVLDLNYNIFLAMPFCAMKNPEKGPLAEPVRRKKEKVSWFSVVFGTGLTGGMYLLLPKGLSWLRTFFALKGWNNGIAAFGSLAVCAVLLFMLWLLWKAGSLLWLFRDGKCLALLGGIVFLLAGSLFLINGTIEQGLQTQADRLKKEKSIIAQIQAAATMPVYAAEPEALYQRSGISLAEHSFSTDELGRAPQGSIFVDQDTEALTIINTGGQYTLISSWSGLYSYDPAVIEALTNQGYEWKSYYSGRRSVDLRETAVFHGKVSQIDSLSLGEGERVETINMKTDFYRGTYEICFTLSTLRITEPDSGKRDILFGSEGTEPWEDHAISLELIGENGNQVLYQEWLSPDDFNEAAKCTRTLNCSLESVPEVYFAVETGNHISVTIEEISWQRIS